MKTFPLFLIVVTLVLSPVWPVAAEAASQQRAATDEVRKANRAKYLESEDFLQAGGPAVYRGESLEAISFVLGGIGTGCIQIDGGAVRSKWQIFNNMRAVAIPGSFFAVRVAAEGLPAQARALQTRPVGPVPAMKALEMRGEYPFAWYRFEDDELPVAVSMETFNFLIPMDAKNSAIPCAVFNLTAENTADKPVSVSFVGVQQNAATVDLVARRAEVKAAEKAGRRASNAAAEVKGAAVLHLVTPGAGDMALMAIGEGKVTPACKAPAELLEDMKGSGALGEAPGSHSGAVVSSFELRAGESRTVTFVLTWHFPGGRHGAPRWPDWSPVGCRYEHWWKDAVEVAAYVKDNLATLTAQTRLFHKTLYETNLPYWLRDRLTSQLAVLRSKTVFWSRDGNFGGWEGQAPTSGCCAGSCTHVWHYAQAYAYLYPRLGRKMREIELSIQAENGALPHRMNRGHKPATDGMCGSILSIYRGHLLSADKAWLAKVWPRTQKAMDYVIAQWDADRDGVLAGPQWNTLDCASGGSSSWLGSMYLAALAASEKMALIMGDEKAAAAYRQVRLSGQKKQDETLFNGEYYIQIPGPKPHKDYGPGCHIDQALGVWWANQLDLGWVYPRDRVRTAMRSLFKYNFHTDFIGRRQSPRKFVADHDAGMQMITWPKGGVPPKGHVMNYASEVMTGFEYAAAAAMVQCGLVKEGFTVVRAVSDRYDGRLRKGLSPGATASWGYSGNPFGDDECGKFYARAMSVWSMLLACQGFVCDAPAGVIGFRPVWRPDDHKSFFSAAEGWGLFTQTRTGRGQLARIELRYGRLRVGRVLLEAPEKARFERVKVTVAGEPVAAELKIEGTRACVNLREAVTLEAGKAIEINLF